MAGELAVFSSHRGFRFTGPGGFMVMRSGGAFLAMVGGVEYSREEVEKQQSELGASVSSPLALRSRILYDTLRNVCVGGP